MISDTEQKILSAAKKVFLSKGYAATKTRDIAEEADINIASLHYYYRSKDKLFRIIAEDAIRSFNQKLDCIFCKDYELDKKVASFVAESIDFFQQNPFIPLFIVNEAHHNLQHMDSLLKCSENMGALAIQLNDMADEGHIKRVDANQFMIDLLGMTIFPFIGMPMLKKQLNLSSSEFDKLLNERKKLIPQLIMNTLLI